MIFSRLSHIPPRLATGAFILNSGLDKRGVDAESAAGIHGMAVNTYPFLGDMDPVAFVKLVSRAEIAIGILLLLPAIPTWFASLALAGFSGGLLGLYLKTPGLRKDGSIRPSQAGVGIAKDVWLAGIAGGLLIDSLTPRKKIVIGHKAA